MTAGELGTKFKSGEAIVNQGETGDCLYVIQDGEVEVVQDRDGSEVRLAVLGKSDFFGEGGLFEKEKRSATVRALGNARVLTVDRKTLLRRIQEDPTLAYRIIETLSSRIRELNTRVSQSNAGE